MHGRHLAALVLFLALAGCGTGQTAVPDAGIADQANDNGRIEDSAATDRTLDLGALETRGKDQSAPPEISADLPPDQMQPETHLWDLDSKADVSLCDSDADCQATNPPAPACHTWVCDWEKGCIQAPLTATPCDDSDLCTTDDSCAAGQCIGQSLDCTDGDQCTADGCDPEKGCWNEPSPGAACNDADACTEGDTCTEGQCIGVEVVCDDGDGCTMDDCDSMTGCIFAPLTGNPCDDNDECTDGDSCQAGVCTGLAFNCIDGNPCTLDLCQPESGCVFPPATGTVCNDGNACTDDDQCVEGTCMGQSTACQDGNPCTLDSCDSQGGCIHTQPPGLPCEDGDACTTGDKCYQGQCQPGTSVECDDDNSCTTDSCDPQSGCVFDNLPGDACDDGDACTTDDSCVAGMCVGQSISCTDSTICTQDTCDPAVGCVFVPIEAECDDGDPCTEGDYCAAGACQPGPNPQCLAIQRIVLAGDSWSTGLIIPLREALDDRGYEEVVLSWELTSKPGSKLAGWLADSNMMTSLFVALDVEPKAELLVFTLSGNDYLGACKNGLALTGPLGWLTFMLKVQSDLQTFVALAKAGRPHLKILLIGYDFLHFEMIQALGQAMPGMDQLSFNLGLIELAARGRDVGLATPDMIYAHNMGLCQHTFGDYFHPPFLCPNPAFGCPEYGPGQAPFPGPAPTYTPFPGGWYTYPGPLDHVPDGIHLSPAGYRAVADNSLDQGAADWIEGN